MYNTENSKEVQRCNASRLSTAGRLVISIVQEGHDGDLDQVVAVEMVKTG